MCSCLHEEEAHWGRHAAQHGAVRSPQCARARIPSLRQSALVEAWIPAPLVVGHVSSHQRPGTRRRGVGAARCATRRVVEEDDEAPWPTCRFTGDLDSRRYGPASQGRTAALDSLTPLGLGRHVRERSRRATVGGSIREAVHSVT
ncbi:hypothetical protein E2562_024218 [Oryza meyeriana var. granulata]|uniref:Uncharacterized protein n=1 Tax=Oryza meyeriana var. granulata TaxID=110450 RepID=A0A6G1C0J8_9ORYZ|nr:hypothetical protein E2562_024218 [Oryza meyeriana var. granulata]